jgi:hypothetical protein
VFSWKVVEIIRDWLMIARCGRAFGSGTFREMLAPTKQKCDIAAG